MAKIECIKGGLCMSYKTLYKLFYSSKKEFENEYNKRFNAENAVHLRFDINGNPAFFLETPEIFKLVISIERKNDYIKDLLVDLPKKAVNQFITRCLIDEIVVSNNIEGVFSTRREINEIFNNTGKTRKNKRFVGLVKKYIVLIQEKNIPLDNYKDIRKIYDDIFLEEIKEYDPKNIPDGECFRKDSTDVLSETQKVIHTGLYPEKKIIEYMKYGMDILNNKDIDILFKTAIFHYMFGYIHPFYDGNGRTSRFISSYLLSKNLNKIIGFRISLTIKNNINKYYEAFKICNHPNNKGDITPFIEMFLNIIDISQEKLCEALEERSEALHRYEKLIKKYMIKTTGSCENNIFSLYFVLAQATLFSENGISQKELIEVSGVSYNKLKSDLEKIPENMIITTREGRLIHYKLNLEELDATNE